MTTGEVRPSVAAARWAPAVWRGLRAISWGELTHVDAQ
jgi:hypothetical protein